MEHWKWQPGTSVEKMRAAIPGSLHNSGSWYRFYLASSACNPWISMQNTFPHPKLPTIIVVPHIDTIYDHQYGFLWTQAFHQHYKSTEKLRIWPVFHILLVKNRIHILFFSPGTTYWDYCCTTKKPVTDTAGSPFFSKSLFKLKPFLLTHLWTLLTTNCS